MTIQNKKDYNSGDLLEDLKYWNCVQIDFIHSNLFKEKTNSMGLMGPNFYSELLEIAGLSHSSKT